MHTIKCFAAISLLAAFSLLNCTGKTAGPLSEPKASNQQQPVAKKISIADLQKLRWIEGTWRGTGVNQAPFFERYRFESDTTLAVDSFDDEKVTKVTDTTRFELKDGEFGGGSSGSRYVATVLDDNSITFEPALKARNSFVWKRESKDSWTAIIKPLGTPDKPSKEVIYNMERWPKNQ